MMFIHCTSYYFVCLCLLAPILAWYLHCLHCFTYWKKRGIPTEPPIFPAGNIGSSILGQVNLFTTIENLYRKFKNKGHRHAGIYFFNGPVYVPIDPEIVKSILTTKFDHFVDRGTYVNKEKFCLTGHLFSLTGHEWRNLRRKISPAFSTGKLKALYEVFMKHTDKLITILDKEASKGNEINIKYIALNFTADIISSTAFGIDAKSLENPKNELSENLSKIFSPSLWLYFQMLVMDGLKNPGNLLRVMHSDKAVETFFKKLLNQMVEFRDATKLPCKDLMSTLLEIRDTVGLSFNALLAQCFLFFLAGFETSSQTISYCIHELAQNRDLQNRLREEIFENMGSDFRQYSYDDVLKMPYLDQVFKETLRLYPVLGVLNRVCVKPYSVPGTDMIIEEGTPVLISTLGLQRDPEYYPDPLRFDPDRFEKDKIQVPFTYMPFGEGPRFCIGMRFGTLQSKLGIAALISQYRFLPTPKTPKLIEFDRLSKSPSMSLREGITVKIEKL